ncbi:MAG: DNA replication and repair protein RecF [Bacteroidetes bacterium]|nr:DNA replication and repair protein RecF [Bacteroidota bacterium]
MYINSLLINNLRNQIDSYYEFEQGINYIYGENGVGKTTILEAISICSITRSFTNASSDIMLVNKDALEYSIITNYINDLNLSGKINVSYNRKKKQKSIFINYGEKVLPKDIIGEIPTVVLSPEHKNITNGSPEYRRQFLNTVLSQANKLYMLKLYEFRRSLKNRNIILQKLNEKEDKDFIDILNNWSYLHFDICADIILKRQAFLNEFIPYFIEAYQEVSDSKEIVNIVYQPNGITQIDNKDDIKETMFQKYLKMQKTEIQRGTSLLGPQKDEIKIFINDGIAKEYASQGQHKTLLIALKFAEFKYLINHKNNVPIILFDDIFSELDRDRVLRVINLLSKSNAQIFITSTDTYCIENNRDLINKFIEIKK